MHKHHIIPKYEWRERFGTLTGVNTLDNVVLLTVEQHSQVHQLLFELNGRWQDKIASQGLSGGIPGENVLKEINKKIHTGKIVSVETRQKMRLAKLGVPKSLEHRINNSKAQMGKVLSEEPRTKMSQLRRGKSPRMWGK